MQSCACQKPSKVDAWYDLVNRAVRFERRRMNVVVPSTHPARACAEQRYIPIVLMDSVWTALRAICITDLSTRQCGRLVAQKVKVVDLFLTGTGSLFLTSYRSTSCRRPLDEQALSITSCRIASYGPPPVGQCFTYRWTVSTWCEAVYARYYEIHVLTAGAEPTLVYARQA